MSSPLARKMRWTEEEYLSFEDHSPDKHEYLDGEIYGMAGAGFLHNAIAANMIAIIRGLTRGGRCQGFTSDQRIHLPRKKFYTYADGGAVCGRRELSEKDGLSLLNPALLFEVLSPSTREYDRGAKLLLYQQIPSLTDILLIDQPVHLVEHYHRGTRGWRIAARRRGGISVLGGIVRLDELYDVAEEE